MKKILLGLMLVCSVFVFQNKVFSMGEIIDFINTSNQIKELEKEKEKELEKKRECGITNEVKEFQSKENKLLLIKFDKPSDSNCLISEMGYIYLSYFDNYMLSDDNNYYIFIKEDYNSTYYNSIYNISVNSNKTEIIKIPKEKSLKVFNPKNINIIKEIPINEKSIENIYKIFFDNLYNYLSKEYPNEYKKENKEDIWIQYYFIGMTEKEMILSLGYPNKVNRTVGENYIHKQNIYKYSSSYSIYIYTEDGIVTNYQR